MGSVVTVRLSFSVIWLLLTDLNLSTMVIRILLALIEIGLSNNLYLKNLHISRNNTDHCQHRVIRSFLVIGGSKSGPSFWSNIFNCMQFSLKNSQNNRLASKPLELASPLRLGNPGSTTARSATPTFHL